ncbi:thioredoxin family protein [Leptolyngbyaceae cyanobacterium UHCC 1019]
MSSLLQRRRMLTYLGLGLMGAAGVTLAARFKQEASMSEAEASVEEGDRTINFAAASTNRLPEFQGISQWLNSPPLTVADLKGNVALIQFWTFSCINCQRTLPSVTRWHQQYAGKGLKVIGIHTPEFAFERDPNNVKQALQKNGITYPVPMDNQFKTWSAYKNEYWPHLFLADRQGIIRYDHIGEGAYDKTDKMIRQLLS